MTHWLCCVENTVKDRIMDSGASFHATYCKEELKRFKQRPGKTLKDVRYIPGLKRRLISVRIGMNKLASKGNVLDVRKVDIYFCKPGGLGKQKKLSFIMSEKTRKLHRERRDSCRGFEDVMGIFSGSSDTSEGSENSRRFEDSERSDEEYSEDRESSTKEGFETPHWKKVINKEMVSLEKNQMCSLFKISTGKKTSQRLWMFKVKEELDGRKRQVQFRRSSLTGFPAQSIRSFDAIALDLPYLLVLIIETSQSRQHGFYFSWGKEEVGMEEGDYPLDFKGFAGENEGKKGCVGIGRERDEQCKEHVVDEVEVNMDNFKFQIDKEDESLGKDPIVPNVNVREDNLEVLEIDSLENDLEDVSQNARSLRLRKLKKKHSSYKFFIGREFINSDLAKDLIRTHVVESRRNLYFEK
uniref:Transposase, mutator type n=1 Tax=Tanacetum cinerariifolium TaxID=118510 RepID=A0A6L2N6G8_TANCI|nr:transposase, mutator type [Tanacetum cinerariifolium]